MNAAHWIISMIGLSILTAGGMWLIHRRNSRHH